MGIYPIDGNWQLPIEITDASPQNQAIIGQISDLVAILPKH
jgi:hypothetical protein